MRFWEKERVLEFYVRDTFQNISGNFTRSFPSMSSAFHQCHSKLQTPKPERQAVVTREIIKQLPARSGPPCKVFEINVGRLQVEHIDQICKPLRRRKIITLAQFPDQRQQQCVFCVSHACTKQYLLRCCSATFGQILIFGKHQSEGARNFNPKQQNMMRRSVHVVKILNMITWDITKHPPR